jgi:hypothetical protein
VKILLPHQSVNIKGILTANQFLPSRACIMVHRVILVPQPPLPRLTRGLLHRLPPTSLEAQTAWLSSIVAASHIDYYYYTEVQ